MPALPSPRQTAAARQALAIAVALAWLYGLIAVALPQRAAAPGAATQGHSFDLLPALASAKVQRQDGRACQPDGSDGRFRCGDEDWDFVGPYAARVAGEAGPCVWIHAAPGGVATELTLADVALPARLRGALALVQGAGHGKPLRLELRVDDASLAQLEVEDDRGSAPLDVALPPGPPRGALVLRWLATRHDWRMACLRLVGEGTRPAVASDVTAGSDGGDDLEARPDPVPGPDGAAAPRAAGDEAPARDRPTPAPRQAEDHAAPEQAR